MTVRALTGLLFVFTASAVSLQAQVFQGPLNPSTVSEEFFACLACPGTMWSNRSFVELPDSQPATTQLSAAGMCFQSTCYYSRALEPSNFGFALPVAATITGVQVDILRKASVLNSIKDSLVQLLINNVPVGNNMAQPVFWPNASYQYISYGDSANTWGMSLLPGNVNNPTFGLYVKPVNRNTVASFCTAMIDHIRMTIYYTLPSGLPGIQASDGVTIEQKPGWIEVNTIQKGSLSLYNVNGRQVSDKKVEAGIFKMETASLPPGIYFLDFRWQEHRVTKTIFVP